jgi:hypothetical protein
MGDSQTGREDRWDGPTDPDRHRAGRDGRRDPAGWVPVAAQFRADPPPRLEVSPGGWVHIRPDQPWSWSRLLDGPQELAERRRPRPRPAEPVPPVRDRVDWWPEGDDVYRGTDGYRVEPPAGRHAVGCGWPGSWIAGEQWRRAAGDSPEAFRWWAERYRTGTAELDAWLERWDPAREPAGKQRWEDAVEVAPVQRPGVLVQRPAPARVGSPARIGWTASTVRRVVRAAVRWIGVAWVARPRPFWNGKG